MDISTSEKKNDRWEHPQFVIEVIARFPDDAYKAIRLTCHDLPGLVSVGTKNNLDISYEHRFHFIIPRDYPQGLGTIQIVPETPLFHPRIRAVGTKACYAVNGEVDRILIDIIYNILLRPETVRPPSLYKDADFGLDGDKMRWYIKYGPHKIHDHLKDLWRKKQSTTPTPAAVKSGKVKILE